MKYAVGIPGQNARTFFERNLLTGRETLDGEIIVAVNSFTPGVMPDVQPDDDAEPVDLDAALPLPFEDQKANKRAELKLLSDVKAAVYPSEFGDVQIDVESRSNISGAVQMAALAHAAGQPFTERWRMLDNSYHTFNAVEMISFGVSVGEYYSAVKQHSFDLDDEISATADEATLESIDITAGWPT